MTENVIRPSYDPREQNENSKPYNIAHLQDMTIQILEYNLAMTIDVDVVPVTRNYLDGRTDRVNTYIPKLTLESAVIIIPFFVKNHAHLNF